MNITNGTVEYGRNVKVADFENKSAKVSLSFGVEDGMDPLLATSLVFDMAVAEVHRRLGLPVDYPQVDVAKVVAKRTRAKTPPAEVPEENPTLSSVTTPGNPVVSDVPSVADAGLVLDPAIGDMAEMVEADMIEIVPPEPDDAITVQDPSAIDEPADVPEAELALAVTVITDRDLHAGVHLAVARKVSNKAVKDLVAKFNNNTVGMSMTLIPAADRPAFLAALKAL
jgi:hypothetical protein